MILANIFQPLIDIFGPVLVAFHDFLGGSWGWSIILLTVVIRALLLPLAFKQFHSMQKLQRVGPQLKAIQAKYKDDKQRQQQEIMKFYRENDINPFASCLPLVAQIPVFVGLFYTLRTRLRIDICPAKQPGARFEHGHWVVNQAHTVACGAHHGAGFLFINDLTTTATGVTLAVLIVLYVGTQLASSLMMQAPTMDQTQRRIMLLMPLFFVIFIVNFPSGLIVYWITTNAWTMAQQYVIRRRVGPVTPLAAPATGPTATAAAAASGTGDGRPARGVGNGASGAAGTGGVLGGLLRGRPKAEAKEPAAVGGGQRRREGPPPPPPRKRKKRSGRRR